MARSRTRPRTPFTLHPTNYTLRTTPSTYHLSPYTLHPTPRGGMAPFTLHLTPYTLYLGEECREAEYCLVPPSPYTLHPTPSTFHLSLYTMHPTPRGGMALFTLQPTPCTCGRNGEKPNTASYTMHPAAHTSTCFAVWGLVFGVRGCGAWGLGCKVWGVGFGVWGLGVKVNRGCEGFVAHDFRGHVPG
jgi:hypothetical protein